MVAEKLLAISSIGQIPRIGSGQLLVLRPVSMGVKRMSSVMEGSTQGFSTEGHWPTKGHGMLTRGPQVKV